MIQTSIEKDNEMHLNRFKLAPPSPSYIAGLIDGDGCIFIRKIEDGYQSGICIAQCRTNVLQIIRYHFGGSITSCSNRNDKTVDLMDTIWDQETIHKHNVRNQYNLLIRSNEYQLLLEYIKNSFIVKHDRIMCLYEMNKIVHISNKTDEKEQLHLLCSSKTILKDENFLIENSKSLYTTKAILEYSGKGIITSQNIRFLFDDSIIVNIDRLQFIFFA
jgi:hypothetical protein